MYAKISKNGRITIPKLIREKLNIGENSLVLFVVENDGVKLMAVQAEPAESLAGSLKEYAKNYVPLDKLREEIRKDIALDASNSP